VIPDISVHPTTTVKEDYVKILQNLELEKSFDRRQIFANFVLLRPVPKRVLDRGLELFLELEPEPHEVGLWLQSLRWFLEECWKHRIMRWVKAMNEKIFARLNEQGAEDYATQILILFARHATWRDDPKKLGISEIKLVGKACCNERNAEDTLARIQKSPFSSEFAFLKWQLSKPGTFRTYDHEANIRTMDTVRLQGIFDRIKALGKPLRLIEYPELENLLKISSQAVVEELEKTAEGSETEEPLKLLKARLEELLQSNPPPEGVVS